VLAALVWLCGMLGRLCACLRSWGQRPTLSSVQGQRQQVLMLVLVLLAFAAWWCGGWRSR
jgi:hypothetical protein